MGHAYTAVVGVVTEKVGCVSRLPQPSTELYLLSATEIESMINYPGRIGNVSSGRSK